MPYKDPERQRAYQREHVARRRRDFFADKACDWCESTTELELHHRDPEKKETHRIWTWSAARRLAEIAKCIVLCAICHRKAHAQVRRLEAELRNAHGTQCRYQLGCRCEPCRRGHNEYNAKHPAKAVA